MKDHKNMYYIDNLIAFIAKEGTHWIGLEMNFLYQQKVMTSTQLTDLANSLKDLRNLQSFILSFGSLRVSLLHALHS